MREYIILVTKVEKGSFMERLKKYIILLIILLLIPTNAAASEGGVNISQPEIICFETYSSGHTSISVAIKNAPEIIEISSLDEEELYMSYGVRENSNLTVQFDYSVGDDVSWNYKPSWEPDKAGFFKSPVYIRCNAKKMIITDKILDMQFDEYLDILYEKAYRGDNDGWKNVNLYDFDKNPVFIKARFVYTIEDPKEKKYITFISPWSEPVRVVEHYKVEDILSSDAEEPEKILFGEAELTEGDKPEKDYNADSGRMYILLPAIIAAGTGVIFVIKRKNDK